MTPTPEEKKKCENCGKLHPKTKCWYHDGRSPEDCFDCRQDYVCKSNISPTPDKLAEAKECLNKEKWEKELIECYEQRDVVSIALLIDSLLGACDYLSRAEQKKEMEFKLKKMGEPQLMEFHDLCEWRSKYRGTDSQLYSEGYEQALRDIQQEIINS